MSQDRANDWESFLELCLSTKSVKTLDELFRLFLTLEEKEQLISRYAIVRELIKGQKPQREISKELKVSIAQITRGSNELKTISPKLKTFLNILKEEEDK